MTEQEQNEAIAKAISRKYHKPTEAEVASGSYYQYEPEFTRDLNACAEMEKVLVGTNRWQQYMQRLSEKICADADEPLNYDIETQWGMIHASAPQRCEAFLRTLGLWQDHPTPRA